MAEEKVLAETISEDQLPDTAQPDEITAEIAIIDERIIRDKIYEVRGVKVMLDFELAEIYGYTTSRFNEQVSNNIDKFEGEDFCFYFVNDLLTWHSAA